MLASIRKAGSLARVCCSPGFPVTALYFILNFLGGICRTETFAFYTRIPVCEPPQLSTPRFLFVRLFSPHIGTCSMGFLHQRASLPSHRRRHLTWRRTLVRQNIRRDKGILLTCNTGSDKLVIKAQVLAGGRGKGKFDNGFQGGVHMVDRCVVFVSISSIFIGLSFNIALSKPRSMRGR